MSSGKEEGNFWPIKITGWFVRYLAGLWVKWLFFWWFVGGMVSSWLMFGFGLFVDGLVGLWVVWKVFVYLCVCGRGGFDWSFSKQTFSSFLSTVYHFCFEAGTILRAFNARLGKVDTFLTFITTRKFQQEAKGFNMLLTF